MEKIEKNEQLGLSLFFPADYHEDSFIVSSFNHMAVKTLEAYPNKWNRNTLIIYGSNGSGKTHLLRSLVMKHQPYFMSFDHNYAGNYMQMIGENELIIIENIHDVFKNSNLTEEDLFHILNYILEKNKHIILTANKPVLEWGLALPDLLSRLNSSAIVKIDNPPDEILLQIFSKQLSDMGLFLTPRLLEYVSVRMDMSFLCVQKLSSEINTLCTTQQKPITLNIIKDALTNISDS